MKCISKENRSLIIQIVTGCQDIIAKVTSHTVHHVTFGQSANGTGFAVSAVADLGKDRYGLAIFLFNIQYMKFQPMFIGKFPGQAVRLGRITDALFDSKANVESVGLIPQPGKDIPQ